MLALQENFRAFAIDFRPADRGARAERSNLGKKVNALLKYSHDSFSGEEKKTAAAYRPPISTE